MQGVKRHGQQVIKPRGIFVLGLVALSAVAACDSNGDDRDGVASGLPCAPGTEWPCICEATNEVGIWKCSEDGLSFGPCECGSSPEAGSGTKVDSGVRPDANIQRHDGGAPVGEPCGALGASSDPDLLSAQCESGICTRNPEDGWTMCSERCDSDAVCEELLGTGACCLFIERYASNICSPPISENCRFTLGEPCPAHNVHTECSRRDSDTCVWNEAEDWSYCTIFCASNEVCAPMGEDACCAEADAGALVCLPRSTGACG